MTKLLLLLALVLVLASSAVDCEQNDVGEWQILTKQNFSSQIRLHPHILLLVTVPWSGESRSLKKEVTNLISYRKDEFSSLKLMIVYRNTEKMLADAIGATESITVLCYHYSVSYKYQGILRAQNILSSIYPSMLMLPEELPLKSLNSSEDLKGFIESTDKALILFEFCGWTPKLMARRKNNGTESGIRLQGNHFGRSFDIGTDGMPISRRNDLEKGSETGKLKCGIGNGFRGIPWLGEFSVVDDSDPLQETGNVMFGGQLSCNHKEFWEFDPFFSKFMTLAREFFFPPERHRFGLVSDRSLLEYLGFGDSDSWLAMLYMAGCPGCSKILKEGDDLNSILQINNEVVAELDVGGQDLDTVLPGNKPSILLFVDRSSDSSETRRKCKAALDTFRDLALHHLIPYQFVWPKNDKSGTPSVQSNQALSSTFGHPRLKLSPTSQQIKLKDKMSIMVINDGKPVTLDNIAPDLQGNSLHEILEYLLQKKKQAKLSSLAKELGFQLLSDDFDVKITDVSPSPTVSGEGLVTVIDDPNKDQLTHSTSISAVEPEENSKTTDGVHDEGKTTSFDSQVKLISEEPDQQILDHYFTADKDVKVEENSSSQAHKSGKPPYSQRFRGSFFFCDGNYRLLRALTGGSTIPSVVIVDPASQHHYVFSEEASFSYSSLADFLQGFLNGSLLPYQRSESILQSPREATQPPFVNMDFHEVDSIPRVTAHTFSDLVLGVNKSNENASQVCNEDVLVLFSGGWCGFCQRMELVVREVYRALKGYMKMLKSGYRNGQTDFSGENLKNVIFKFPHIYMLDCTLNDCSSILKSTAQREVYPTLMLFPAERKHGIPYDGDITVANIIKFIADHGNNSRHLISEKGILSNVAEKGGRHQNLFVDSSSTTVHEEAPVSKESFHEIILKSGTPKTTEKDDRIKPHAFNGMDGITHHVSVGSVLIATDRLLNAQPFDNSEILIVKADQGIGFQGLIFNKQIRWDSVHKLEEGLEFLKEASLSFGGPLIKRGMPLVGLTRRVTENQYPEVLPGVCFLDQSATMNEIEELKSGNHSISDYWFFLGYSSWGWDQLFNEIAEGAWTTDVDDTRHFNWPSS